MSSSGNHVHLLVDDYVHELLGPEEAARVDVHCASCASCARALEEARRRLALLQSVPPTEPAADLVGHTVEQVEGYRRRARSLKKRVLLSAAGALAAAVLVLVGLHVYYSNLSPTNYDLVLLGQNRLMAGSPASLRVILRDRGGSGKPIAGVPVQVALLSHQGERHQLAEFTTDEQGAGNPRFDLPDWADGRYQLEVAAKTGWSQEVVSQPVNLTRSWKLMLSSDKPVYKPGQTIQLRALALRRPDLKPVSEQPAVFTLTDPKGNILFKHKEPTSKFGITSASCPLANEITEGIYTVGCQIGDEKNQTKSQIAVEVKRYVLPKFKLEVTPDRPYYKPGESVKLTVQGDYFFGKPVSRGRVEVKVLSSTTGANVLETLTGDTDDKGKAELSYTVPLTLATGQDGDARLLFAATLTDTAKQKQERLVQRLVTRNSHRVEAIPESGRLVRDVGNVVYLLVTRADGEPVPGARIAVLGDGVKADLQSDERGAAAVTLKPAKDNVSMTITVSSRDGDVLTRRVARFACNKVIGDFLVRTDRAAYKGGQSMTITALGGGVEPVFIDFIKDGQTLASETVDVQNGKGEHTFDIPAGLFGTIEMVAYRFGENGLPLRKRRVIYVSPADSLRIQATLDKAEYQPGRKASLNLALTDMSGKPTPGAISLAAVDEAVFAVLAQRPGMEEVFYTLEESLLKPVFAIYPWTPGDERAKQRDLALFAKTSQALGGEAVPDRRSVRSLEPAGQHTLVVNSFSKKEETTREVRESRLEVIRYCWAAVIAASILTAYLSLWLLFPATQVMQWHGVVAVVMMFLFAGVFLLMPVDVRERSFSVASGIVLDDSRSLNLPQSGPSPLGEVTFNPDGRRMTANDTVQLNYALDDIEELSVRSPVDTTTASGEFATRLKDMRESDRSPRRPAPRVRQFFPETLLWKPQLITDDNGKLPPLPIDIADSITTWRLSASAVSADGRLGAMQMPMKVFQPFFVDLDMPVFLTRGDEIGMPAVVYNYLNKPQTVALTLAEGNWFTLTGKATQTITLAPGEVRSTRFSINVKTVGNHKLRVTALAGEVGDAIEREIEVMPDGHKFEFVNSGSLDQPVTHTLTVPQGAIEGSVKAFVKIYPSGFSQLVEGLDNIFQMPHGCFEQTSSTTYPNILALQYLRSTKQSAPKVAAKARTFIHLGYQRLVTFEVQGGGFDWYGRPPANRTLSAYGLMEFVDMAKVHDVDPKLIERTRSWLLAQRKGDGSWDPDTWTAHDQSSEDAKSRRLAATAYIAWAVFGDAPNVDARQTLDYLLGHSPKEIKSPHVLALVCNALLAIDPKSKDAAEYVNELASRRKQDGKLAWWEPPADGRMLFHGAGESAKVETTALATLALLNSDQKSLATPALTWLVTKKDARGTWHTTQATVLALKALVTGTTKSLSGDGDRRITVKIGDKTLPINIRADQAEVLRMEEITKYLKPGDNKVSLSEQSKTSAGYQVVFRYHIEEAKVAAAVGPLTIAVAYDRTDLTVDESVKATAMVTNLMTTSSPMVMLDLPVPPGFQPDTSAFAKLVQDGKIARYELQPRRVLVYLRSLESAKPLALPYTMRATMPVKATAGAARVYEYYDPQKQGTSPARLFTVRAR